MAKAFPFLTRFINPCRQQTEALAESKAETDALVRLNEASSRLWAMHNLDQGLNEILATIIDLMRSDFGSVQLYDEKRCVLTIAAQQGFGPEFLEAFKEVTAEYGAHFGQALSTGKPILIEDVETDPIVGPFRAIARAAGYRSMISVALLGREHQPLGMISTHFREPHPPSEAEMRRLNWYAEQAARYIERCRMEESQTVQQQLNAAIEGAELGIWHWDLITQQLTWSERCRVHLGLPPGQEPSFEHFHTILHPDDQAWVQARIQQAVEDRTDYTAEYRVIWADGSLHWLSAPGRVYMNANNKAVSMTGVTEDITARKQAEETLRLSQFTLESASEAVYWIRPDSTFFYVNAAACGMLGYTRDQLSRMAVTDLDADYQEAHWQEHFAELKRQGSLLLETTHRTFDGRVIPVEVSANYITFEGREYNCAIVRDITARRAAEKEQRLTRLAVEQASDSIYWLREDGSIYYVNETACRSLGYTRDALQAMTVFDIDPAYSRAMWTEHWHSVNRAETVLIETLHQRRDGSRFPVEVTSNYLELDGQNLKCSIVRDITERKAAEAELLQRTHLLESAQAAAHLGYYLTDLKTRQWTGSPRLDDIMGIDDAYEHTVEGWSQLVHPEDRRKSTAEFEYALEWQEPLHHQYRIVRPCDGTVIWVDAWGMFEYDAGHPVRLIGTVMDITERKKAEEELEQYRTRLETLVEQRSQALAKSEERFRLAMKATNDGLWDYNAISNKVYLNPTYAMMLGYEPGELGDQFESVFGSLLHPDDRERILKHIFDRFQHQGHHETEFRLRAKDGQYRWIYGRGQVVERDAAGAPLRMIGTHVDITDRKSTELALVESERRFKEMADSAPVMIWISGLDKLCTYFNKTWLEFTGRTLEQEVGNGWAEGVHPDDFDQCLSIYTTAFDARQAFTMDYRLRRHDGEYRWIQDTGTPRFDGQSQFLGYIGSCVDVTDRRRIEQQIRDINVSLEQKVEERTAQLAAASAAKTQFLAHMSHELRTPMNAVLGLAQLLEKEPLEPGELAMVRHIRESGDSLLHIINDILDFSKIEAGQLRLDPQPFTLSEVLSRVDNLLRLSTESKGLTLLVRDSTDCGVLVGDPLRLEQILINLTGNAIKFTTQGGVTVSVSSVATDATGVLIRFEVQDTGIGIAPDVINKLFLPFSQADASITRNFGGTGLGLAISRRLADLMGGQMGVTSQIGQGSTFWFELPFQQAAEQRAEIEPIETKDTLPAGPELTGLRILAVDDSRLNLMVVERALTREGAKVTLAADGQQALQILKAQPHAFDVVLMDIQMPVMDGLTATREIRQDAVLSPLPVIALTAGVLPEERQAALDAGVNGFLAKPIDLEQLMSGLAKFLPVH